ncbi:hypothetical protein ILUMI_22097 [Ignelater luminosus]|uniref:Tr-type G domain-containing protein n=1 Tax=Ignelater luminosus TaxID=2038154 RepID=A0A8K0CB89_IGNLU|nr:hypothetical protein ILUMI_22097 [Ignelater luminosus]
MAAVLNQLRQERPDVSIEEFSEPQDSDPLPVTSASSSPASATLWKSSLTPGSDAERQSPKNRTVDRYPSGVPEALLFGQNPVTSHFCCTEQLAAQGPARGPSSLSNSLCCIRDLDRLKPILCCFLELYLNVLQWLMSYDVKELTHPENGSIEIQIIPTDHTSTAAFDKNPQSKARGITLDLGFSSFYLPVPTHLQDKVSQDKIQLTLVDCPGHASLIRTIIGGAQIIDLILLVIDVTKGIQTQTAECLVIGEITCKNMIVVLNKIDLLEEDKKIQHVEKMKKRLKHVLSTTCFADAAIISISANPKDTDKPSGIEDLMQQISKSVFIPLRQVDRPFLFAIDHCFGIKGKGTVITGTVLQGSINIDDAIDLPAINTTKKVKSMQMFKKPVVSSKAGDRLGICVTQFDPKLMERGIACSPGLANFIYCCILPVNKIKYFKNQIKSKSKFHITIGHETAMGTVTCFNHNDNSAVDLTKDYFYSEHLNDDPDISLQEYMLIEFEKPVLAVDNCKIIGSRLDMDMHGNDCRIAFWGNLLISCKEKEYKTCFLPNLKVYKNKCKTGIVERLVNENTVIVKNIFKKETNIEVFIGLKVNLSTGEIGIIESSFGQSGKIKVYVKDGLNQDTLDILNSKSKTENKTAIVVTLLFKKYIYNISRNITQ